MKNHELEWLQVELSSSFTLLHESIKRIEYFSKTIKAQTGEKQPEFYYLSLHPQFNECMDFIKNLESGAFPITEAMRYGEVFKYCAAIANGMESEFIEANKNGFINGRS